MFGRYRTQHEPEVRRTVRLVIDSLEGRIDDRDLRARLIERDRRLKLEVESSHPLGYVAGTLASVFPEAKFIITVREPLRWLRSRLNFHYQVHPRAWTEYRDYFWLQRHESYASEERVLEEYDLCSLDTYLSQYADHYERVFTEVPAERRILVRTAEINQAAPEIAGFLGVDAAKLVRAHSNRSDDKITPLDHIDDGYVRSRILQHCGDLLEQVFPERIPYYTGLA
jgi:tetrahydromethanopterin S-methyltransferase subunit F